MARKKVKHSMILNERVRKSTMKRRVENFYKKAHELSILCGIEIFIVLLNRKEDDLTFWPSQDEAMNGIQKFLSFPEQERLKKMVLQEKHLTDKMQDMAEQISKLQQNNKEAEMRILMKQVADGSKTFDELDSGQLDDLNHFIGKNLERLRRRGNELDDEMQTRFSSIINNNNNQGNQGENIIVDQELNLNVNQGWPTVFSP